MIRLLNNRGRVSSFFCWTVETLFRFCALSGRVSHTAEAKDVLDFLLAVSEHERG